MTPRSEQLAPRRESAFFLLISAGSLAPVIGFAIAFFPTALSAVTLVILALLAPPWLLLGSAIVAGRIFPDFSFAGPFHLADAALVLFLLSWLGRRIARGSVSFADPPLLGLLGATLAWWWASLVLTDSWNTAWALARITVYAAVFAAATADERLAPPLSRFIALYAVAEAILAFGGVSHRVDGRLAGLYGDPGLFGALMLAGLSSARSLSPKLRPLVYSLTLPALILTFTRGIWLAATVTLLILMWSRLRKRLFRAMALAAALLAAGWWLVPLATAQFGLEPQSITLRIESWRTALMLMEAEPLLGHGWALGQLLEQGLRPPFNLWLNIGASTGFVGVVLLSAFLFRLIRTLSRSEIPLARVWFPYLVGFLILSLGEMTLYAGSPLTIEFVILVGSALGAAAPTRGHTLPSPGRSASPSVATRHSVPITNF
jgi:hypothetical protein